MSIRLNEPLNLAHIRLKNRVIRSAVHSFLPDADGYMTEAEYAMYEELAAGQAGMIISGHCCVEKSGRANPEQVNIYDDRYTEQFRRAAAIAHREGAVFIPQLSHAGPRAIDTEDLADVVARPLKKGRAARALTREEIHRIVRSFAAAAKRIKSAGCDGVQLHAAHSYLLSRFIDPTFNQRTDEYGGSAENRFRIVEEIIRGIQAACGEAFPVLIKINVDTAHEDAAAYRQDMIWMLRRCRMLGVELAELSGVDFISQPKTATLYYLEQAAELKKLVPEQPLSLVGGVRSLDDMEKVLSSGIEAVSLGRALIAEPDFVKKQLAGGGKSICISCSRCFVLPHIHAGIRCVWAWKAEKERRKAQKQPLSGQE